VQRSLIERLYPTKVQDASLPAMLGALCDPDNAAPQQRVAAYRRRRIALRYNNRALELKAVRQADERLAEDSFAAEALRLDETLCVFFARLKGGARPRFPREEGLTIRKSGGSIVGIPGEIRVKWHRPLPAAAKVTAVSSSAGTSYICFQIELPVADPAERQFNPVGIDLGLSSALALSTRQRVPIPQHPANAVKALRRAQRAVVRRRRNDNRPREIRLCVARLHARVANRRCDFSPTLSRSLVDGFARILEDPKINGLARGMPAKSVADAAWNQLDQHVWYKAECADTVVSIIDPRGTSQMCPQCGTIRPSKLSDREHRCDCGCVLHRHVAAARIVELWANFRPGRGLQALTTKLA
jgi:putative transposase